MLPALLTSQHTSCFLRWFVKQTGTETKSKTNRECSMTLIWGFLYKAQFEVTYQYTHEFAFLLIRVRLIRKQEQNHQRERGDAVASKIDVISVRVSERKRERLITVTDQTAAHLHRGRCFVYTDFGLIMDSTSVPKHCLLRFPLISPHLLKSSRQETCRREGTHAPHLLPLSALSSSWS